MTAGFTQGSIAQVTKMLKIHWLMAIATVALASCGGGSSSCSTSFAGCGSGSGGGGGGGGGTTGPSVAAVTVTTSAPSILSDGSTTATITALVRDASNNLIAGVPVTFTATSGGIAVTQATTDTSGAALATLTTAGDASLRTITVTATASGKVANVPVQVVAGSTSTSVQMGSPAGASFQPSVIEISSAVLSAGGSTTLRVFLQQSDGTLYAQPATVTFSSNCAGQNLATITSPVNTSSGVATATYVAKGCSGADLVTATATIGSNPLSASGSITIAAASIGSIIYKSATPTTISLKGVGSSSTPETSTVVFQVLDQSGGPVAGAAVVFSLNTAVGGISVDAGPINSDVNGNVITTVHAGTVATPVRVTATVQSTTPAISTQSNQLTVSTGIPTQNAFSLAVSCHNVEALNIDGVTVAVTARLADRFSNPVADGTAVSFNSEGGHIQPSCQTTTSPTESGFCTVNWVSANPRPTVGSGGRAGRSTLFAMAIGEESFVDGNGNGAFDNGETFTDLGERFRDDNGNGVYDPGEFFYDFNNDGVRNAADGIFNGVLCHDTSGRCDSTKQSTGIATSNLIIMSGSTPDNINPAVGTTLATASVAKGTQTYYFTVADVNNNPMPAGTVVSATVQGTGLSLASPSTFTYPCATEPLTYAFTVIMAASAAANGLLVVDVKTGGAGGNGGVESVLNYPFTVGP
jgi:hypothetical protein